MYHLHDEVSANVALLRRLLEPRVHVVLLAVYLVVDVVEGLAAEGAAAGAAHEALGVEQAAHGLAGLGAAVDWLAASHAVTYEAKKMLIRFGKGLKSLTHCQFDRETTFNFQEILETDNPKATLLVISSIYIANSKDSI